MEKEFLNPPGLPNWEQTFSQLVIVKAGGVRTISVSPARSPSMSKRI
jgi:hypothetical protein